MIKRSHLLLSLTFIISHLFAANDKLFFEPCNPFSTNMKFDCYHDFKEMSQFLKDAHKKYPQFTKLESIGKSYEGRDLWVLTITDFSSGEPENKPGIWIDGGVDSDEVIATEAALGLVHRLLTSDDKEIINLRKTRVFYILPNMIPDGSEQQHHSVLRPRDSTLKPWDDDNDGKFDEDAPEDLDGDNMALQMRVEDLSGNWVKDEKDHRLLRQRKPDDKGPYYERYSEGIDNDGDGDYNEDWPGGIDPNRNYPGNWSLKQRGSGAFPGSEVELRSVLDFIYDHPNIAASQSLHSSGGVILRPPSVPDMKLPSSDLRLYIALSERGLNVTEYGLATSVYQWNWPRGSKNSGKGQLKRTDKGKIKGMDPFDGGGNHYGQLMEEDAYAAYGGSLDGLYELFGILAFANEIYRFGDDLDNDGRVSASEQLKYDDEQMESKVFKDWTPFDHPTLGKVEIGGWKKFGHNNPLPPFLAKEVDRNVEFMLLQARSTPLLSISKVDQEYLGKNIYRLTTTINNYGFQPTELAIRVINKKSVPVRTYLSVPKNVMILDEETEKSIEKINGNGKEEVTWLVHGSKGSNISIGVYHPKGGRALKKIKLLR
jgi:hypothetical protein|tara:strand:+ start:215 stop:2008 length:1794 start_codon:yes stop_codon:yes gene_type:complete